MGVCESCMDGGGGFDNAETDRVTRENLQIFQPLVEEMNTRIGMERTLIKQLEVQRDGLARQADGAPSRAQRDRMASILRDVKVHEAEIRRLTNNRQFAVAKMREQTRLADTSKMANLAKRVGHNTRKLNLDPDELMNTFDEAGESYAESVDVFRAVDGGIQNVSEIEARTVDDELAIEVEDDGIRNDVDSAFHVDRLPSAAGKEEERKVEDHSEDAEMANLVSGITDSSAYSSSIRHRKVHFSENKEDDNEAFLDSLMA